MNEYIVRITTTLEKEVKVIANTPEAAEGEARVLYKDTSLLLVPENFIDIEFEAREARNGK